MRILEEDTENMAGYKEGQICDCRRREREEEREEGRKGVTKGERGRKRGRKGGRE